MRKYLSDELLDVFDSERKITHRAFADKIEKIIDNAKWFKEKLKMPEDFDSLQLDWAYPPTVQSGSSFDTKLNAAADDKPLKEGVVIASLGFKYNTYGSLCSRTFVVSPTKAQETNYRALEAAHEAAQHASKEGATAKSVYEKALGALTSKKPELEKHFGKNVGWAIGIENRDPQLALNAKNDRVLEDGMTFVLSTSLDDVQDSKDGKKYSMMISDTIRLNPANSTQGSVTCFTRDAQSQWADINFEFKDEEDEKPKSKPKKDARTGAVSAANITKTRTRGERVTNQDAEKEAARRDHQKELHQKKQQAGLERYGQDTGSLNGSEEKVFKKFESYKRDNQLPSKVDQLMIIVDERNATVVFPIMGRPVPFHINTIKNASKTDEGDMTYLRINFLSPGQGVGRKDDQPFEDANAHFVRSLTFRSKDMDRMDEIMSQITELKKKSVRREQEKKELEDVVEQDKLIEARGGNRQARTLENIYLRPSLEGKRLSGRVEIHQNGLRYTHLTGQHVDVLFSNIKHMFFQPCDNELIVIIHVHLINPIMIGKKKSKDVQFYREATDVAFDETGNRKRKYRHGDEDEFEAEQEERRQRARLNKEFKAYAERVSDAGRAENVAVDIPFRDLGFNGVPARSSVYIQPTTDCLIQVTEPPYTVVTLAEIEVVHLERVQFGLKNFDMVIVLKDFQKAPIHINTIPVESLDGVKDWLDSVDIPFSEGPLNLNWATIMKTVTADPHSFFAEGGWSFLAAESDDEGEEEEEEESDFAVSDEELAHMSEESSEDDSEFDDDASDDEGSEADELSEDGEDWDEMEAKAKKSDANAGREEEAAAAAAASSRKSKGGKPKKR